MKLFDCHTHLFEYPRNEISEILDRASDVGIAGVILAGTTLESSKACVALAQEDSRVFAGIGIHPMDIEGELDEYTINELRELAKDPRVVVVSEVGLDGMEGAPEHSLQERVLRAHIQIGHEMALPVIYHARFSYPRILEVLEQENAGELGGAAHYFQGSVETAYRCIDMGFFISLARPLLRMPELQEVTRKIPLDKIVLETDSYPQPFKKKRESWTEPRHIVEVAQAVADIKGVGIDEVIEQAGRNLIFMLGNRATDINALIDSD